MKRKIASSLLILGLLASSMVDANAILGLSKCEKAKAQITNEEKVGVLLHKKYAEQRKIVLGLSSPTLKNLSNAMSWLPDVYDSDLRIFKIVDRNASCFTPKQVARARSEASASKKNISDIAEIGKFLIDNTSAGKTPLGEAQIKILRDLYPNYYAFLTNKKLN